MNCKKIYIISGERGSGKTTLAEKFIAVLHRNSVQVGGIITRSAPTERYGMKDAYAAVDILTGEQHPLLSAVSTGRLSGGSETTEPGAGSDGSKSIGRFNLNMETFSWAASRIEEAITACEALIIDELGPLEVQKEGYYHVAKKVVSRYKGLILFIVRSGLVAQIIKISGCDPQKIVQFDAEAETAENIHRFAYEVFENE